MVWGMLKADSRLTLLWSQGAVPSKDPLAYSPINLLDQNLHPICASPVHELCIKEDVGQPSKPEGFSLWDRKRKQNPESLQRKEQGKVLRKQVGAVGCTGMSAFEQDFTARPNIHTGSAYLVSIRSPPMHSTSGPREMCPPQTALLLEVTLHWTA